MDRKPIKYLSVCSGIEAASVAWHSLGWKPVGFAEIEKFPAAVLQHRFPHVPNFGDMTRYADWPLESESVDLLVGGTPCQSFSVAGLRKGLTDPRGGLMLTYLEIARRFRPRWIVWENVPGVLSSNGGRDFGSFLGALGELGYGWAYRVLDAQWVRTHGHPHAVPQRRRRVFVVGCFGDPAAAAAVLFERESVQRDSASRGKTRQEAAADVGTGTAERVWPAAIAPTLNASFGNKQGLEDQHALGGAGHFVPEVSRCITRGEGFRLDMESTTMPPVIVGAIDCRISAQRAQNAQSGHLIPVSGTLGNRGSRQTELDGHGAYVPVPMAFQQNQVGEVRTSEVAGTVNTNSNPSGRNTPMVAIGTDCYNGAQPIGLDEEQNAMVGAFGTLKARTNGGGFEGSVMAPEVAHASTMTVRRLTPRECERLQGFPDDWTLIPWRGKDAEDCPDGPRYKALGNSMAVNCMEWIGQRIDDLEKKGGNR